VVLVGTIRDAMKEEVHQFRMRCPSFKDMSKVSADAANKILQSLEIEVDILKELPEKVRDLLVSQ
jgi:hypothetical protein